MIGRVTDQHLIRREDAGNVGDGQETDNAVRDGRCTLRDERYEKKEERLGSSETEHAVEGMETPDPGTGEPVVRWSYVFLAWAVVALVFSLQNVVGALASGDGVDWSWAVYHEVLYWAVWAALTPAILSWATRYRLGTDAGWRPWIAHLGLAAVIAPLHIALAYGLHGASLGAIGMLPLEALPGWLAERRVGFLVISVTGFWKYAVVVGVYYAFDYYRRWRREREQAAALELRAARLEGQLASSRLSALRSQLRPHFLFNTLNSIAVLVRDEPEKAEETIRELSGLLRKTLEQGDVEEVPLNEELAFLERYLEIQRTRYEERLGVEFEIDSDAEDLRVPFLLLQPLVENAVGHGVERHPRGGTITVRANRAGGRLRLVVEDRPAIEDREDGATGEQGVRPSPPGFPEESGSAGGGTGLANVRERLEKLYPGDHRFEASRSAAGGFVVEVELPVREEARTDGGTDEP